tara:strand:+ start:506 stop:1741 length:1236 start_codon:yes stop_codon:yes gene_type:complete
MYDLIVMWEWIGFLLRWVHVITAIAWIGSSFYFIALDLSLNRNIKGLADGEEWQVHGGGFYHIQKYMVAPSEMPEHLTWFKWESYFTWLSGFAVLIVVYWFGADLYLVDPQVSDISSTMAIFISGGSLVVCWLVYDFLCWSKLKNNPTTLMLVLYLLLVGLALFFSNFLSGKAALLHLGAVTATIMTANVFLVIMPNQRVVVADLKSGKVPDSKYGNIAKIRSTHNNYLTLPVIFLMLSAHYPLAFGTHYNWIIASIIFIIGVLIRHYFNSKHARKRLPNWTWGLSAILFIIIMWLSTEPFISNVENTSLGDQNSRLDTKFARAPGFNEVKDIVSTRCTVCHAAEPAWEGLHWPPKGMVFETSEDIELNAKFIFLHSGLSKSMPPGNLSGITENERDIIRKWYRAAKKLGS